jgi:hypothetical protein
MVTAKTLIDEECSQPARGFGDCQKRPPAFQAMMRIDRVFHEFDSNSTAMVVLKGSGEETD